MSARPKFTLVESDAAPTPVAQPQRVPRRPVELRPIAWGKPEPALGRALCEHLADAMPATVIRFNPFTHARLRRGLRALGIHA